MNQEFKVTPQMVFEATDGGLDIILQYYPQAAACVGNKKYFKIREEGSASARLDKYNGLWWVKDFGDSGRSMTAIDVMLKEDSRKLTFAECMADLGDKYSLTQDTIKQKAEYKYEKLPYRDGDVVGNISFQTKDWDMAELQSVFAKKVWELLMEKGRSRLDGGKLEEKSDEVAMRNAAELCKEYGLLSLEYYDLCGRDKGSENLVTHRFGSTATYPILMWEAGTWQKIYKPTVRDKQYRFVIRGQKSRVMFGFANAKKKQLEYEENEKDNLRAKARGNEDKLEEIERKSFKLPEVIICSGGSDALNVAAMGYPVVWFDSEMFSLTSKEYADLSSLAHKIYYLPDIDTTGVREAVKTGMKWLNIHLIFLPNDLRKEYDMRGNQCKDVRDFLRNNGSHEFDICLKQSMPLRFWDENYKANAKTGELVVKNGKAVIEFKPNNELMYNFLYRNDFGLYEMPSAKNGQIMVRKRGNVVERIAFRHINQFIKDFLSVDSVMRLVEYNWVELRNAFHRSAQFSETSMDNLKFLSLDFNDTGKEFQYMFFENETWKVTKKGITPIKHDKVPCVAWEEEVIKDRVKVLEQPLFEIFENDGEIDIKINSRECHYLNFMINNSRIFWRKELEDELDKKPIAEQAKYREDHKFSIDGPLLSPEEIKQQKRVLISKLVSFGYLLHRYKDESEAYTIWGTDYNMMQGTSGEEDSHGGTGKSMTYHNLSRYMRTKFINGRDKKQLESPHVMEGTTEHTDYLFLDDAMKAIDFDFWYGFVTGFMTVNPKGTTEYILAFEDSPKMAITSNFMPNKNDKSTRRRLWFTTFSDYYHKNPNGEYREERLPKEEFGMTLFREFDGEQWNLTHNMHATCVQMWMKYGKIDSADENMEKNMLRQKMGPNFMAWADEFFHPENNRIDTYYMRTIATEDAKKRVSNSLTPQGFIERLRAWCQYKGYVLNPKSMLGKDGRIMKHIELMEYRNGNIVTLQEKGTRECIFIQSGADDGLRQAQPDNGVERVGEQLRIGEVKRDDLPF